MSRSRSSPNESREAPRKYNRDHQTALLGEGREWLAGQGYTEIVTRYLNASPFRFEVEGVHAPGWRHRVLNGRKGGKWVVVDPLPFCDVRRLIRRISWLLGQKFPTVPALIAFIVPEDLPLDLDIGMMGLSTRIEVVRAGGVKLGWSPRRPLRSEYSVWIRVVPRGRGGRT